MAKKEQKTKQQAVRELNIQFISSNSSYSKIKHFIEGQRNKAVESPIFFLLKKEKVVVLTIAINCILTTMSSRS